MTDIEKEYTKIWKEYLQDASGKELFCSAVTFNYDDLSISHPLINKFLTDPSADKGAVLAFYWYCGPRFMKQYTRDNVPDYQKERFEIISRIEDQYVTGFYKNAEIYFDPTSDDGGNWTEDYLEYDPERTLPSIMEQPVNGSEWIDAPHESFEDGVPFEVAEKLHNLYD